MKTVSIDDLLRKSAEAYARGDRKSAEASLEEVVRREPGNAGALNNLGLLCFESGKAAKAIVWYERALEIDPACGETWCNLADALASRGEADRAVHGYRKALAVKPDLYEANIGLGALLESAGDLEPARDCYIAALRANPRSAAAHFRLGVIMRQWDRPVEAAACFRNVLRFDHANPAAHLNLGEALQASGRLEESEACFNDALALAPGNNLACSNLLLGMNYNPAYTPEAIFKEHRRWGERFGSLPAAPAEPFAGAGPERRLRIGYVSSDFCRHPAGRFIMPLLRFRNRDRFEVFCYSQGKVHDELTDAFKALADGWREIRAHSDDEVAAMIRQDRIDLLIDCTGHMADNRLPLFARRCAPVQASWIGYPNTTGLRTMDYRFTDAVCDPPGVSALFTEELIRLPGGFCCFLPADRTPAVSPLPGLKNGRITFGSLHTPVRLNSMVVALWSRVLQNVPGSRLLMFRTTLEDEIIARLTGMFGANGIGSDRLEFQRTLPSHGYLAVYNRIDIALDTLPWSGHTTACEALWMGVPVITLRGNRHAGRMTASVLTRVGMEEWIAPSAEEYVAIARQKAADLPMLAEFRGVLREKMRKSSLCDGAGFVKEVEKAYRECYKKKVNS